MGRKLGIVGTVTLSLTSAVALVGCTALGAPKLHTDQLGYGSSEPKMVAIVGAEGPFSIVDEATGQKVFTGQTVAGIKDDESSGDSVNWADFSGVTKEGKYHVEFADAVSYPFTLTDHPYTALKDATLKGYYYQRCGTELPEQFAGPWKHAACHLSLGMEYGNLSKTVDVSGGWHDAGDYGRYIVNGAVPVAELLMAYELMPETFGDSLAIPESGNGVPDILDEVRWELQWMLKMQKHDGGVYHKAASYNFPGFIMPEKDQTEVILCPVSATATADLGAVAAMASRIYKPFDKAFSAQLLAAAQKSWEWLKANPNAPGFRNPQGVTTGEYGNSDTRDEQLWTATSLYRTTADDKYAQAALNMLRRWPDVNRTSFDWGTVGGFAAAEVLFMKGANPKLRDEFVDSFISAADRFKDMAASDGYKVPMMPNDYNWGSNSILMNRGMHLLLASKLTGDKSYESVALNCLHWLVGRNPMGFCYVTGLGSKSTRNPHHRPSTADKVRNPVPGLVAGGPNKYLNDPTAQKFLSKNPWPAKAFIDNVDSYSTNEIAVNWNAPAVFVAAWFDR